jgi:hypothetical protein
VDQLLSRVPTEHERNGNPKLLTDYRVSVRELTQESMRSAIHARPPDPLQRMPRTATGLPMTGLDVRRRPGHRILTRRPSSGRHRQGRPSTQPNHHEWDSAQRAKAAQLDLLEPGWLVLYGPYYRRFYAIARTSAVSESVVEATTPEELRALMRQAEVIHAPTNRGTARRRPANTDTVLTPAQRGKRW